MAPILYLNSCVWRLWPHDLLLPSHTRCFRRYLSPFSLLQNSNIGCPQPVMVLCQQSLNWNYWYHMLPLKAIVYLRTFSRVFHRYRIKVTHRWRLNGTFYYMFITIILIYFISQNWIIRKLTSACMLVILLSSISAREVGITY